jgi:hypothetical protein
LEHEGISGGLFLFTTAAERPEKSVITAEAVTKDLRLNIMDVRDS